MKNKPTCLYPDCNKVSDARGLCKNHYVTAYTLVQKGKTTWETLEKNGKILPRTVQRNWFLQGTKAKRGGNKTNLGYRKHYCEYCDDEVLRVKRGLAIHLKRVHGKTLKQNTEQHKETRAAMKTVNDMTQEEISKMVAPYRQPFNEPIEIPVRKLDNRLD